jgi:hypothetical protein
MGRAFAILVNTTGLNTIDKLTYKLQINFSTEIGTPRSTHDSLQVGIHDAFPMVNCQFQFPTHCKHVTITTTRDAHGGLL